MTDRDPALSAIFAALLRREAEASTRMSRDPDVGTYVIETNQEDQP